MIIDELAAKLAARINNLRSIQYMLQNYDGQLNEKDIRLLSDLIDCEETDEIKAFLRERGDLENKTMTQLRDIAKDLGIQQIWIYNKYELIGRIQCLMKVKN